MAMNGPLSGSDAGIEASFPLPPQQIGEPSSRSPHVWAPPLLIATNRSPLGGDDWPTTFQPQHAGLPSYLSPQV